MLGHFHNGTNSINLDLHFLGDLLRSGFTAVFLHQLLLHTHQLVDRLDHVHRDTDRPGLIGDRTGDRLTNPPRGVGGELVTASVLEFFHRLHEAHVALLNQVEERQAAVGVLFRNRDHEAQVGLNHLGLGLMRLAGEVLEFLVGVEVILSWFADKRLKRRQLALLSLQHHVHLRRTWSLAELLNRAKVLLHLVVDIIRNERHLLDHLLLEQEFGEVLLQLVVQLVELAEHLPCTALRGFAPGEILLVHLAILFADFLDETMQGLEMLVARLDHLVQGHTIKPFLRWIRSQLFSQCNVLLRRETQSVKDSLHLKLGILNTLGDFNLLFAREKRHLTHLLKIHPDRIIQNVQTGFLGFRSGLGGFLARGRIQLLNNLHLEALEFLQHLLEFFRSHQFAR